MPQVHKFFFIKAFFSCVMVNVYARTVDVIAGKLAIIPVYFIRT
jgi:hypothetical protein